MSASIQMVKMHPFKMQRDRFEIFVKLELSQRI